MFLAARRQIAALFPTRKATGVEAVDGAHCGVGCELRADNATFVATEENPDDLIVFPASLPPAPQGRVKSRSIVRSY
jgi:hypothetical protein